MAGIYVHIPFCSQACYYCDFHFSTSFKIKKRVLLSIKKELQIQKNFLKNIPVETIYFGGGSPSILESSEISTIINSIFKTFSLAKDPEITIEANPEDIKADKIMDWHRMGVNRVSLGIQALSDNHLKYMNRAHDKAQAFQSIELLSKSKIDNINVDLIYGFPGLTNLNWRKNIHSIIMYNVSHVSCYCLTVEAKTPLQHFINTNKYKPLNSSQGRDQFIIAREVLLKNNFLHYEISNFSKQGCQSKHNQNYWDRTPYLGVGPSAHSFNRITRQWNIRNNSIYCQKIESDQICYETEKLNRKDIINEQILTSIRTSCGLDPTALFCHMKILEIKDFKKEINKLEKQKLINTIEGVVRLTEKGMLFSDGISKRLFIL